MVFINASGIHDLITLQKKDGGWWDKTGDFDSPGLGWNGTAWYVSFTSNTKKETQLVLDGAKAMAGMIERMVSHE